VLEPEMSADERAGLAVSAGVLDAAFKSIG
jgi:hypothetical protein